MLFPFSFSWLEIGSRRRCSTNIRSLALQHTMPNASPVGCCSSGGLKEWENPKVATPENLRCDGHYKKLGCPGVVGSIDIEHNQSVRGMNQSINQKGVDLREKPWRRNSNSVSKPINGGAAFEIKGRKQTTFATLLTTCGSNYKSSTHP